MNNDVPIFKPVFGNDWEKLPIVFKKHYMNRPYSHDVVTVEGKMNITSSGLMKYISPLFKLIKVLMPYQGKEIPAIVYLRSDSVSNAYHFDRTFYAPNKPPYSFKSFMLPIKDNIVVEFMFWGIGWRCAYLLKDNQVLLEHRGYVWKMFGFLIPLPISLLLGRVEMLKEAISDDTFRLDMVMIHPLIGKYIYSGELTITDIKS